jgi:predicted MFS family arabinose efflux permease
MRIVDSMNARLREFSTIVEQIGTLRRLLRNRNFSIYFAGQSVSSIGDSFYSVALILAVLQSTRSVTSGAMVLIAGSIPAVILTLIGGALGDRFPRNRVMLSSDFARSAAQFIMAALLIQSHPPLWALIITQCCYGAGGAFFNPASTGLLPQIVPSKDLAAANSSLQFVSNTALVLGPAIAGILISFAGAPLAVAVDAVTFLVSGISLYFLSVPKGVTLASDSLMSQLRSGFSEFRRHRWVLVTACYLAVLAFAFNGTIFVLGPATALQRLGGASAWSLMLSAFGVGLISGSVLALRLLRTRRALGWAYLGNFGVVPMLALLGTSQSKWLVVGSSGVAGISVAVFSVTFPTLLQQTIPEAILSRVGSYFWLARIAPTPIALAIVGPLSAWFGISNVLNVAASVVCMATLVGACSPDIWSIKQPLKEIGSTV